MSTRTCPSCSRICEGYKEECAGPDCGSIPCRICSGDMEDDFKDVRVRVLCYNGLVVKEWSDIDMEVDFPE